MVSNAAPSPRPLQSVLINLLSPILYNVKICENPEVMISFKQSNEFRFFRILQVVFLDESVISLKFNTENPIFIKGMNEPKNGRNYISKSSDNGHKLSRTYNS